MPSIHCQVLECLSRGPLSSSDILAALPEIENPKQLANCLHRLRISGSVQRRDDKRYERVVPFAAADDVHKSKKQRMLEALGRVPRTPTTTPAQGEHGAAPDIRPILEKAIADTQAALDDYLAAVADPSIYGPLRAARDHARAALKALVTGAPARE